MENKKRYSIIEERRHILKFIVAGGLTTLIDFIFYMVLSLIISIVLAKAISMSIACSISFVINKKWTFKDKERYNLRQVINYILVQLINILVNTSINTGIYNIFRNKFIAFFFATLGAMIINYLLQKRLVFNKN